MRAKHVKKRQKSRLTKILLRVAIVLCLVVVAATGAIMVSVVAEIKDFNLDNLSLTTNSTIVNADNEIIYKYGGATGKYVEYKDIPEVMIDAVVAAEDARFFKHNGFDIPRIVKAFFSNLLAGHITAGGSTITQQLVKKTFYPEAQQTIKRKVGEIILSIEASGTLSKQKVLELYLNKIYFGKGTNTIGLYAASYYYFDKKPKYLTLPEAALLAGTINSPYSYDPFNDIDRAQRRRDIILLLMKNHGYIDEAMYQSAKSIPVANILKSNPLRNSTQYAAYTDQVTSEVIERTGFDPNTVPMTIYTYMDTDIQDTINDIASQKSYRFSDQDMQAGATVMESKTGRIIGILAAKDYQAGYYSYATEKHQPGSSIKPVLDYSTAFEYLYWSTGHYVSDDKVKIGNWTPSNWDKRTHGDVSLYDALGNSWNLAAINALSAVLEKVDIKEVNKYMKGLGYDMDNESLSLAYAIGGWSQGVTTTQQAAAYAAISNGGTYIEPHTVNKVIVNTTGETFNIDDDLQAEATQAMADSTSFLTRHVMTNVVKKYGSYTRLNAIGDKIGAKTGTSNHDGSIKKIPSGSSKDIWMCCFSPDYAWAAWNGYPGSIQTSKGKHPVSGQNDSHDIAIMIGQALHKKKLGNKYTTPKTVEKATMVRGSYPYRKASAGNGVTEWFVKGHGPKGGSSDGGSTSDSFKLKGFSASLSGNTLSVKFSPSNTSKSFVRVARVYNGSSLITSKTFDSNSGTITFSAEKGMTYTVDGYLQTSDGGTKSNTISVSVSDSSSSEPEVGTATFSVSANGSGVSNGATITASSITVSTKGPSGNTVTIQCGGHSKNVKCGESATFSVSKGQSYTVSATESNGSKSSSIGSISFSVAAKSDDKPDSGDDDGGGSGEDDGGGSQSDDGNNTEG
ncbi:MAG: transglycosylase domain-containing protein [Erysipelotrichaceae bacterium]|nr:transglycosylase domain-containing protein [Erysipelotrichaceae bacterium]